MCWVRQKQMLMKKIVLRLAFLCMMSLFALGVSATPDKDYLCFTANKDDSAVELITRMKKAAVTLEYSTDDGVNWSDLSIGTANSSGVITTHGTVIALQKDKKVYLRNKKEAKDGTEFSSSEIKRYQFVMDGSIAASGNIMSLVDKNCAVTEIPCKCCFNYLFQSCESLTSAPKLPATTLTEKCYERMFEGCTNLTTAPELPATTLTTNCYVEMFLKCSNLNFIKVAFTDWNSSEHSTDNWIASVTSAVTFVCPSKLKTNDNVIPSDWTVWRPELTAPSIAYVSKEQTFSATIGDYMTNPTIKFYVKKEDAEYGDALEGDKYTPKDAGTYTVKVEATDGFFKSPIITEKTFTVKDLPVITDLKPTSIYLGDNFTFHATTKNFDYDPTVSYYVKKSGDAEYGDALKDFTFTPQEAGTYDVKVVAKSSGQPTAEKVFSFTVKAVQFDLTVSDLGWASLYFDENLVIPDGTKVYYASEQNGDVISLMEIKDYIPAYTAVIVKAEPGTYAFPFATEDVDALEETNLFTGLLEDKPTVDVQDWDENKNKTLYVLADKDAANGTPIFSKYTGETLGAFKMYLPIEGSKAANMKFRIVNEDIEDGIVRLTGKAADSRMYNTLGMPVNAGYNGVILKGGKKFINIKK